MESENPAWGRKRVSPLAMRLPETLGLLVVANIELETARINIFACSILSVLGPNEFVTSSTTPATTADRTGPERRMSNLSVALTQAADNSTFRTEEAP